MKCQSLFLNWAPEFGLQLHEIRIRASRFFCVPIKLKDNSEMGAESEHKASFPLLGNLLSSFRCAWHPQNNGLITTVRRCIPFTAEPWWRKFIGQSPWLHILFIKDECCKYLSWRAEENGKFVCILNSPRGEQ